MSPFKDNFDWPAIQLLSSLPSPPLWMSSPALTAVTITSANWPLIAIVIIGAGGYWAKFRLAAVIYCATVRREILELVTIVVVPLSVLISATFDHCLHHHRLLLFRSSLLSAVPLPDSTSGVLRALLRPSPMIWSWNWTLVDQPNLPICWLIWFDSFRTSSTPFFFTVFERFRGIFFKPRPVQHAYMSIWQV